MQNVISIELKRDCEAVQIPAGNTVILPAGTVADITQTLGGTCTIHTPGGLFRIAARDSDALGLDAAEKENAAVAGELNDELVWMTLRSCFDPEIPVNIGILGLVYDMRIDRLPDGRAAAFVKMTLTAAGCGMGGVYCRRRATKITRVAGCGRSLGRNCLGPSVASFHDHGNGT